MPADRSTPAALRSTVSPCCCIFILKLEKPSFRVLLGCSACSSWPRVDSSSSLSSCNLRLHFGNQALFCSATVPLSLSFHLTRFKRLLKFSPSLYEAINVGLLAAVELRFGLEIVTADLQKIFELFLDIAQTDDGKLFSVTASLALDKVAANCCYLLVQTDYGDRLRNASCPFISEVATGNLKRPLELLHIFFCADD